MFNSTLSETRLASSSSSSSSSSLPVAADPQFSDPLYLYVILAPPEGVFKCQFKFKYQKTTMRTLDRVHFFIYHQFPFYIIWEGSFLSYSILVCNLCMYVCVCVCVCVCVKEIERERKKERERGRFITRIFNALLLISGSQELSLRGIQLQ